MSLDVVVFKELRESQYENEGGNAMRLVRLCRTLLQSYTCVSQNCPDLTMLY